MCRATDSTTPRASLLRPRILLVCDDRSGDERAEDAPGREAGRNSGILRTRLAARESRESSRGGDRHRQCRSSHAEPPRRSRSQNALESTRRQRL